MPRISELRPRRREQWVEIRPDEGEPLLLPVHALPAWWQPGFVVSPDEWAMLSRNAEYHQLYERAVKLLARREHFGEELRRKLAMRSREAGLIDEVLLRCREQGFINERRAAEIISEQLSGRGPLGAPKLRGELLRRGCHRALADEMVTQFCTGQDSFSVSLEMLESRRRHFESRLDQLRRRLAGRREGRQLHMELSAKLSASMLSYLATRGFGDSEARQAVREFCTRLLGEDD